MATTESHRFWSLGARRTQLFTALPRNELAERLKEQVAVESGPFDGQFSDYSALLRRSHDDVPRACRFSDGPSELSLVFADSEVGTVVRCEFDPPTFTCWRAMAVFCAVAATLAPMLIDSLIVRIAAPAGLVVAGFAAFWAGQREFWLDEHSLLDIVKAALRTHEELAGPR